MSVCMNKRPYDLAIEKLCMYRDDLVEKIVSDILEG
jgi:hypothetical protein